MPCHGHPELEFLHSTSTNPTVLEALAIRDLVRLDDRSELNVFREFPNRIGLEDEITSLQEWLGEVNEAGPDSVRKMMALLDGGIVELLVGVIALGPDSGSEKEDVLVSGRIKNSLRVYWGCSVVID